MNKFMMVLDETLADSYKLDKNFSFMNESIISGKKVWNFSIKENSELKFKLFDKKKVIFTNRLNF